MGQGWWRGAVHFSLTLWDGGTQLQEPLAQCGLSCPLSANKPSWDGWAGASCAAFPPLEHLKTFLGCAGTDPGTLYPSVQPGLEKKQNKAQKWEPGTVGVDLWSLCASV